jgi:predicted SnoaL-like aldol condensation-catalyzing enzyme
LPHRLCGNQADFAALTLTAFTVFRLADGKIAEEWEILDELGMMQQLGMELKPIAAKKK